MALKFIGERTVGTLNGMKSGFVKDDLYRVYDAGILVPGGVSVDHGDFVSWDGTKWVKEADIKIATNELVDKSTANLAPEYSATSTYPAGSYVIHDGVLYKNPNAIITAEAWNSDHWTETTVVDMIANSVPTWKRKTTSVHVTGGQSESQTINDHEVVDLAVTKSGGSGQGTLKLHLYGECYVFLNKGPNVIVSTFNKDDVLPTTNTVFGTPELDKEGVSVLTPVGSLVPEEWDPNEIGVDSVCGIDDTNITISKPSLTSTAQQKMIIHSLGDGTVFIIPEPV